MSPSRLPIRALACGVALASAAAHVGAADADAASPTLRNSLSLTLAPAPLAQAGTGTMATPWVLPTGVAQPGSDTCRLQDGAGQGFLTLSRALELILCRSPGLRQALANVREQSANVELADLAWRPSVNLYAERASNRIPTSNSGSGSLSESLTGSMGVSWVIFDFGVRSANLEQARQSLASAIASQDAAALVTLRDALKLYVDASAAWARLDALREAELLARQSADAARAKHEALVGSLSEKLQAETALAQATLDRVRANGAWRAAAAALSISMGLPASATLQLPDAKTGFPELGDEVPDATALEALREQHPRVLALQADARALKARLESVRADGRGSLNLSGSVAATRQLGQSAAGVDRSISTSLLASIPLFNGAEQKAREAQVLSQIAARDAVLTAAQRDIDTTLVLAAQQLEIERQGQQAARALLIAATQGYDVALGRYRAGVGSIIELLGAQSALSSAQSQALQAVIARANAQIGLAVAAGRLGPSALRKP